MSQKEFTPTLLWCYFIRSGGRPPLLHRQNWHRDFDADPNSYLGWHFGHADLGHC